MVRIIVGTLLEIGLGKRDAESVSQALEKRDRELAGPNAPPWGLTLDSVHYPEAFRLWEQKFQEILK
jgi:tRNA pseudouridine38-40 synthase